MSTMPTWQAQSARPNLLAGAALCVALGMTGTSAFASLTFTNYTTANGLAANDVRGVSEIGGTIYAATVGGGISISTDGGTTWSTRNQANSGLGSDNLYGVYVSGSNIYAATAGGGGSPPRTSHRRSRRTSS